MPCIDCLGLGTSLECYQHSRVVRLTKEIGQSYLRKTESTTYCVNASVYFNVTQISGKHWAQ
jgi:hypothetical protein